MTVCISALSEPTVGEPQYVVNVCDRMVSMSGIFSGDNAVRKIDPISYGWTSQIAGNDVSPAMPIIDRFKRATKGSDVYDSMAEMARAFKVAFKEERLEQIEDEILSPMGFTWETFQDQGKAKLPDIVFMQVIDQIRTYELDLSFLISGFDERGEPQVFTVSNPGKCDYYTKLGFWAIGSGAQQALASLFASKYNRHNPLEVTVAKVLAAKLAAESATGVGKKTWAMIDSADVRNKSMMMEPEAIDAFRSRWDNLQKFPRDGVAEIKEILAKERARIKEKQENLQAPAVVPLIAQKSEPGP